MRKKEGVEGIFQRHKGLLVRVLVPLVLILVVVLVLSTSSSTQGGNYPEKYAIVFDAGSTGSRIHVFKFYDVKGQLELDSDTFEQLKPGLSSYADDPKQAAESLQPLMEVALQRVPEELQSSTKVMVGATAGLRLLPEGKADKILEAVVEYLKASPFELVDNGVRVIDGSEEGAFAWLTLNYLLGLLGEDPTKTVAAIDLGGGSVQQAFALAAEEVLRAPRKDYVSKLSGGGANYNVYVHSYLGFGLMAARAEVISFNGSNIGHPCFPVGHEGVYEYGGNTHTIKAHPDGASFDKCAGQVVAALDKDKDCGAPQDECTFRGVWNGKRRPEVLYVSSYFWDKAMESHILGEEGMVTAQIAVSRLSDAAKEVCSTGLNDITNKFPKVDEKQGAFLCLDLSFMHTLLTKGFKIPDATTVTLVKRVVYKGQEIEAAWPLGAAINILNS